MCVCVCVCACVACHKPASIRRENSDGSPPHAATASAHMPLEWSRDVSCEMYEGFTVGILGVYGCNIRGSSILFNTRGSRL